MKFSSLLLIGISFLIICCSGPKTNPDQSHVNSRSLEPIEKNEISKIILLVADTSIIDPANKELPPLVRIGDAASIVDSFGKIAVKPTQEIIITDSTKNELIDIFNSYLKTPQDENITTNCFIIYRHVFILYDAKDKISEQIHLCLDCTKLNFLKRGALIQFLESDKALFTELTRKLRKVGAYVPNRL